MQRLEYPSTIIIRRSEKVNDTFIIRLQSHDLRVCHGVPGCVLIMLFSMNRDRDGLDMEFVHQSNLEFFHCLKPPHNICQQHEAGSFTPRISAEAELAPGGEAWESFAACNKPGYLKNRALKKQWKAMVTRALTAYLRAQDTEWQQAEAEGRTLGGAAKPTPSDVAGATEAQEKRWALTCVENKAAAASRATLEALNLTANERAHGTCCVSNDEFHLLLLGQLPMLLRCYVLGRLGGIQPVERTSSSQGVLSVFVNGM